MWLEHCENCFQLIKILKLQNYYPKKITRQQALTVSKKTISPEDLKDNGNIPWFILQNLIIGNYEGRSFESSTVTSSTAGCLKHSDMFRGDDQTGSTDTEQVNPLDALVATMWCCDDFLRQLLAEKLSMCQLGIPFLLPVISDKNPACEMLLWATSTLRKRWKTRSGSSCDRSMAVHPLPVVSALRIGRPRISKSEILNSVINDNKHDTFFHSGCEGGEAPSILSVGMLDMTWYLPNGSERDYFSDAFTVMNLHGSASNLQKQMSFLTAISAITIVFCNSDTKDEDEIDLIKSWCHQNSHLILVFDGKLGQEWRSSISAVEQAFSDTEVKQLRTIIYSDRNRFRKIREILVALMTAPFNENSPRISLEDCEQIANRETVVVDYNCNGENVQAMYYATDLLHCFENSKDKWKIKQLPLQIEATNITIKKRELSKRNQNNDKRIEFVAEEITHEIKSIRIRQRECHQNTTELILMNKFLKLMDFTTCGRKYFYHWVTLMLDRYSIKHMQPLREKFIILHRNDQKESEGRVKKNLQSTENEMFNVSVGMENLTREMAQIYEMASELKKNVDHKDRFPELAAEMLLDGHPLELMDGDATHVPLTWLKKVLACLENKIGNKRVFILSVLGVQGSGKSTMLNTMFGLQFAVSAGRCTKGAFAQLVPLDTSLAHSTKCDYILVIDTEGLRALEIGSTERQNRDNAIATFVIGLADATIINIMGDNAIDMEDTLQIAVHAFMKMKYVNLQPSCLFVHQNITDVTAYEMNSIQRLRLKEMLDESTKIASKEHMAGQTPSFSDIIKFRGDEHVDYITTLCCGTPPMAPQNPGYSQGIANVRKKVLTIMKEVNGQTINEFKCRLSDLWNAVLCEDFVFSFKNTFEIQAYNDLETKYLQQSRELKMNTMTICNDLVNTCRKNSADDIELHGEKIFEDHKCELATAIKRFYEGMDTYYSEYPMATRWKNETKDKMSNLCSELRKTLKNEFYIVKRTVTGREKINHRLRECEQIIHDKSHGLAVRFRDSEFTESDKERTFNDIWKELIETVPHTTEHFNIMTELKDVIQHTFGRHEDVVTKLLSSPTNILKINVSTDDIVHKSYLHKLKKSLKMDEISEAEKRQVLCYSDVTSRVTLTIIKDYERRGLNCNELVLKQLVDTVREKLEEVPAHYQIEFTPTGIARRTIGILWPLLPQLEDLQKTFMQQNDLRMYMCSQKDRLWQLFNNECMLVGTTMKAISVVSLTLTNAIEEAIKRHLPTTVIEHFRDSPLHRRIFANKRSFHAKMLLDLGEMKSFNTFTSYLTNPAYYMTNWLEAYIIRSLEMDSEIEGISVLQRFYNMCVGAYFSEAKLAIEHACKITEPTCNFDEWWENLICNFKMISITRKAPQLLGMDINLEDFLEKLPMEVNIAEEEVQNKYKSETILKNIIGPTVEFFEKDLIGCEYVCPFCHAPCDHLSDCTHHQTECHRPQGLSGRRWDESRIVHRVAQRISGTNRRSELVIDLCTSIVNTSQVFLHEEKWQPFKKFKEIYPDWEIKPTGTESQLYWKWFMAKFNKQLADFHGCKEGCIPDSWDNITWESAKRDMIDLYDLEHE